MSNLLLVCFSEYFIEKHKMHNCICYLRIGYQTFGGKQPEAVTDVVYT